LDLGTSRRIITFGILTAVMKTMNTSNLHKMLSGALVLLSVTSLGLFYFSSSPPGIDGNALAHLFACGRGLEISSFLSRAELHSRLLPFVKLLLPFALVLMALLSVFSFHSSRSSESK
jgi:hypothetical protein